MINNARGSHVSPGVYMKEVDVTYSTQSLGQTTLGLVGETKKGPAFQPVHIQSWSEFVDYFGETSPEKFPGNVEEKYLKYELPYVAKSYLKESKQLEVCRVLGLSGYDAGNAWPITVSKDGKAYVIAVLRSKAEYTPVKGGGVCNEGLGDQIKWKVKNIESEPYQALSWTSDCENGIGGGVIKGGVEKYKLNVHVTLTNGDDKYYPISLIRTDNDYILNVFGTDPLHGNAEVYVESFFDLALSQMEGIDAERPQIAPIFNDEFKGGFDTNIANFDENKIKALSSDDEKPYVESVDKTNGNIVRFVLKGEETSKFEESIVPDDKYQGGFLKNITDYKEETEMVVEETTGLCFDILRTDKDPKKFYAKEKPEGNAVPGEVYIIEGHKYVFISGHFVIESELDNLVFKTNLETDKKQEGKLFVEKNTGNVFSIGFNEEGLKTYIEEKNIVLKEWNIYNFGEALCQFSKIEIGDAEPAELTTETLYKIGEGIYKYVKEKEEPEEKFVEETIDVSNYKEGFRSAMTPWIVSEVKGSGESMRLNTLFRFHTISDGNAANEQIKVSIQNIDLFTGTFDVIVRDFYDSDKSPIILEKFTKCTMVPNSKDYIAFKIGTIDGSYELKSSYIMLEINENEELYSSVPCGFLGFPMMNFGSSANPVLLSYNKTVIPGLRAKEQYFGLSDLTGIDVDTFLYKGAKAYKGIENLTNGFHLDERLSKVTPKSKDKSSDEKTIEVFVNGTEGYKFDTVSSVGTRSSKPAIMFSEDSTIGTIYEDKKMRKFTVCFYGGFDGWDIFRKERTNTNDYKANVYDGLAYDKGNKNNLIDLPSLCNTSDYYAYLAGAREFSNPEAVDVNLFATPGINWYDQSELTQDIISIIEDPDEGRGGDALYVTSSPFVDNADDAVSFLEETGIDSSYAVTFWPWIKCYDPASQVYINLPVTKDAVRNMAYIDRTFYPWFAPAGLSRGNVECVRATKFTRLSEEDVLYNGMINPVKTYAVDGVKIWGNKTMYSIDSPLNRVNVRRLMIRVKKLISTACRALIFEPNDSTVRNQFLSIVEPILDNVKSNRGIYEYKIEVDNSPEAIDAHTLPAKIMIKPTPTLEYIDLTFVITPIGASFES